MSRTYRIGIFDPAFTKEGHFISFDRYAASLLDNPKYRTVFLDVGGQMRETYKDARDFGSAPEFHRISVPLQVPRLLGRRVGSLILRMKQWQEAYKRIAEAELDCVLITSESYDPFMYLFTPRFKYVLFILNPRLYIFAPSVSSPVRDLLRKAFTRLYRTLAKNAAALVTTSEPPLIKDLERALKLRPISWLPNLPLKTIRPAAGPYTFDFITIGTISKSKNHLFALSAFEAGQLPYRYMIAGLSRDSVGKKVEKEVGRLEGTRNFAIRGEFGYIDDNHYRELLRSSRFALFPYDFARGDISSQVMHDSFQQGVPIVAPDIQPFKWYVENYCIGLLYKEGDAESFTATLRKAHEMGPELLREGFGALERDHALEKIREDFQKILRPLLPRE